jgi:hypothetical protein
MNFVALIDGKIQIRFADDARPVKFRPDETVRMGRHFAKHRTWNFMCSSSCDFPHENGFKRSFDVSQVLGKAVELARARVAIPFKRGPLEGISARLDTIVKKAGFPVSLNFLKSGKRGEDVVITFEDEAQFEFFTGGIRYANRLVNPVDPGRRRS